MATRNGFELDHLQAWIGAMRETPEAGKVGLRTQHHWAGASAVDGKAEALEAGGQTLPRRFTSRSDFPEEFGGANTGPVPGELLLMALGACVTSTFAEKAALQGVELAELEITLDASVDLRGCYEVARVRPGLSGVTMNIRVRCDAPDALLEELGRTAVRTSPVADSLAHGVPLQVSVQRAP
jgi:uncharacterized OsmC-like protein